MNTPRTLLSALLLLPLLAAAGTAPVDTSAPSHEDKQARKARDHEAARAALARGEILPLSRILELVGKRMQGDIIEVELEREHGVFVYEVKLLAGNGRVREIKLDARSGTLVSIEDE